MFNNDSRNYGDNTWAFDLTVKKIHRVHVEAINRWTNGRKKEATSSQTHVTLSCSSEKNGRRSTRRSEEYVTGAGAEPSRGPGPSVFRLDSLGIILASTLPPRDKLCDVNLVADNISRRARSRDVAQSRCVPSFRPNYSNDCLSHFSCVWVTRRKPNYTCNPQGSTGPQIRRKPNTGLCL